MTAKSRLKLTVNPANKTLKTANSFVVAVLGVFLLLTINNIRDTFSFFEYQSSIFASSTSTSSDRYQPIQQGASE